MLFYMYLWKVAMDLVMQLGEQIGRRVSQIFALIWRWSVKLMELLFDEVIAILWHRTYGVQTSVFRKVGIRRREVIVIGLWLVFMHRFFRFFRYYLFLLWWCAHYFRPHVDLWSMWSWRNLIYYSHMHPHICITTLVANLLPRFWISIEWCTGLHKSFWLFYLVIW